MKILAIIGARKGGNTSHVAQEMCRHMQALGDVQIEFLYLHDFDLKYCLGCRICFDKGETSCPHDDDLYSIVEKMKEADGTIFASPAFLNDVSGILKSFIDRTAYFSHRPAFFTKCAYIVTTTHATGNKHTRNTIAGSVFSMGFFYAGSLNLKIPTVKIVPDLAKERPKISASAKRFHKAIAEEKHKSPSLISLITFKIKQKTWGSKKEEGSLDYQYWKKNGFLDTKRNYYIDVRVGWLKKGMIGLMKKLFMIIFG